MKIRSIATAAAVVALTFAGMPAASAASFDENVGGGGRVWYNDGTDTLCASLSSSAGYDVLSMTAKPVTAGRGPTLTYTVHRGERRCKSLATAYEDSKYTYFGTLGYEPPCRCGSRFGGDFFS
jgi:hypothetical protein